MEARKDQYEAYVKSVTPVLSTWKNVLMAGISGGLICLAAQISTNCLVQTGMEEKTAALWTMLGLILLSVILTGANVSSSQYLCNYCPPGTLFTGNRIRCLKKLPGR